MNHAFMIVQTGSGPSTASNRSRSMHKSTLGSLQAAAIDWISSPMFSLHAHTICANFIPSHLSTFDPSYVSRRATPKSDGSLAATAADSSSHPPDRALPLIAEVPNTSLECGSCCRPAEAGVVVEFLIDG